MSEHPEKKNHIDVAVVTTAGTHPAEGFDTVALDQPIKVELERAARELRITNTSTWIATVGEETLNVDASYRANNLSGEIEIHWGPPQRGGGGKAS